MPVLPENPADAHNEVPLHQAEHGILPLGLGQAVNALGRNGVVHLVGLIPCSLKDVIGADVHQLGLHRQGGPHHVQGAHAVHVGAYLGHALRLLHVGIGGAMDNGVRGVGAHGVHHRVRVGQVKVLHIHALVFDTQLRQAAAYVIAQLAAHACYQYFHAFPRFPYIFS